MYQIDFTSAFKKEYKKFVKLGKAKAIDTLIQSLANGENLDQKYKDHALKGEYKGFRECHIEPDLLLIYKKYEDILLLSCVRLGSHTHLFKKQ
ncbi:type II toxin-antitoxin system YafQ family toxin [Helicobacter apodemus]|uniref:Type II toxin-antitoxin system YafQ family toxin n=1 Tax=Helicobacter apodemus TaxID=135569 RepID=A0A4U8UFD3_9HELI|nr:type II toxin-antitoxin system YafQ family toxin [Helicobacter apodemus]TLE16178.1 type II toxin-antitoxin system YafQ family toxin [Helicobacter apodemus]